MRVEFLERLEHELAPLALDLAYRQVHRPQVPQLLHLAAELGLLQKKTEEVIPCGF